MSARRGSLFDELGEDATLIVPHRYAPEHRHKEPTSGTYNVEWLTFRRDEDGWAPLFCQGDDCNATSNEPTDDGGSNGDASGGATGSPDEGG